MNDLKKFMGHPQEVEIKGEMFTIYPLKVKDLRLFMGKDGATPEEQMSMNRELVRKSLNNVKLTDDEIDELSTEFFMELMDAIMKVNGFNNEKINRIREIKEQIAKGGK